MKRRKVITKRKPRVRRERDPIPWKYCVLTLVCGLILVGGFFMAATSHFSAIDYGMKNSKLRRQAEELRSEKRRLLLTREMSLAPAGIKKAGRKIGLRYLTSESIEIVSRRKHVSDELLAKQNTKAERSIKAFMADSKRNNLKAKPSSGRKSTTKNRDKKGSAKRKTGESIQDSLIAEERRIPAKARRR